MLTKTSHLTLPFLFFSVTSEGLEKFLKDLGLNHVRYLKGYANVIGKARELTESGKALAEVAIETSGHCAMRENGYLDDGTYTAVKVVGLLARMIQSEQKKGVATSTGLLDLISNLEEKEEARELRMNVHDGSIVSTNLLFDQMQSLIQKACDCENIWELDEDNLEGIRVRIGNGGFFMLRKSLHDPIISLQIEGDSIDQVREVVIDPIASMLNSSGIADKVDISCLEKY